MVAPTYRWRVCGGSTLTLLPVYMQVYPEHVCDRLRLTTFGGVLCYSAPSILQAILCTSHTASYSSGELRLKNNLMHFIVVIPFAVQHAQRAL